MIYLIVIPVAFVVVSILVILWYADKYGTLKQEHKELCVENEAKEKRIKNLVEYKFPEEYRTGEVWKIRVNDGKYLIEVYKNGRSWESYVESNGEEAKQIINNLIG